MYSALVAEALKHVGYTESPPKSNLNKFSTALGRPAEYWCADFIAFCAKASGTPLPSYSAGTQEMASAFNAQKKLTYDKTGGQPGDIVFFEFGERKQKGKGISSIEHVGIVISTENGIVQSVDGNTSLGKGLQSNGGAVAIKKRPLGTVVAFGRPLPGTGKGLQFTGGGEFQTKKASDHDDWWANASKAAQIASAQTGIFASLILAQWSIETGYGSSDRFRRTRNFGNITAGAGWTGPVDLSGKGYKFRIYSTFEEGAKAYAELINKSNFYNKIKDGKTEREQARLLALSPWDSGGYTGLQLAAGASAVPAAQRDGRLLINLMEKYGLSRFNLSSGAPDFPLGTLLDSTGGYYDTITGRWIPGDIDIEISKLQKMLGVPANGKFDKELEAALAKALGTTSRVDIVINGTTMGQLGIRWVP